jgi:hypothetical protein
MRSILLIIASAFILSPASFGSDIQYQQLTKRMKAIEEKFSLKMVLVEKTQVGEMWIFMAKSDKGRFGILPITVPKKATDKEVEVAMQSAIECALFYESALPPSDKSHNTDDQGI